jgi:Fe-S-cluster-containing dehydrogenase component
MPLKDDNNPHILIDLDRCTGCLNCQLICSFTHHAIFNPALARISIELGLDDEKSAGFTGECAQCKVCVDYCIYGALTLAEGG